MTWQLCKNKVIYISLLFSYTTEGEVVFDEYYQSDVFKMSPRAESLNCYKLRSGARVDFSVEIIK